MKIYGDTRSGNCYKLKLLCSLLSLEHEWIDVDILAGETRSDAFLAMNPNGEIPVCVTDSGDIITLSNAILYCLGAGTVSGRTTVSRRRACSNGNFLSNTAMNRASP